MLHLQYSFLLINTVLLLYKLGHLYAFMSFHKFFHLIIFLYHFEVQKHDNSTSHQTQHTSDYDELMIGRRRVLLTAYRLHLRLYAV